MKITIHGTGYVGLVTGACLADVGHQVLCADVDSRRIERLRAGGLPFYEPGLEPLVQSNQANGQLRFTADPAEAVAFSELQFIAVGTPPQEDGSADLHYVQTVAATIADLMQTAKVVVTKSTVPVGTGDLVHATLAARLQARGLSVQYAVASNPEFLKEGAAVGDFMKPDRIIIGTDNEHARQLLFELYAPFNRNHDRMLVMDLRSAELTKYAANAMLATRISFMNEIANIAEEVGADVEQVRNGIGSDTRIGYQFIYPGCGYGGSCFPKDVRALIHTAGAHQYRSELLQAVEAVNQRQQHRLFDKIHQHYGGDLAGRRFALWGLAFKPRTDDMREAPSRRLMEALWQAGASVQAFDPEAMPETQRLYADQAGLTLHDTKEAALQGAAALVICTEWQHFRAPDFDLLRSALGDRLIFDGRNLYDPLLVERKGLRYYAIGRGASVRRQFSAPA
jgi:UDPglucose 6-dehydrogenase